MNGTGLFSSLVSRWAQSWCWLAGARSAGQDLYQKRIDGVVRVVHETVRRHDYHLATAHVLGNKSQSDQLPDDQMYYSCVCYPRSRLSNPGNSVCQIREAARGARGCGAVVTVRAASRTRSGRRLEGLRSQCYWSMGISSLYRMSAPSTVHRTNSCRLGPCFLMPVHN